VIGKRSRHMLANVLNHFGLFPFVVFATFPFYWMLITSLKKNTELYSLASIPLWIQQGVTFQHYSYLFEKTSFALWLGNTLAVAVLSTVISVSISILAAYALARLRFRGAELVGAGIFAVYLLPPTLLFLPLSRVVSSLHLTDTIWSLVITYPSFMIPFSTWMLMAYFRTIPKEIEECAMIDGCTRLQAIIRVVLPVAIPGVITATLFSFLLAWQDFIYALTFISSSTHKTLTVGVVAELVRGDVFFWGSLMGGALLASAPVVLVFVFLLDYYISGLTAGAVKS